MNSAVRFRAALLFGVSLVLLAPSVARADVCVWRDPERTMEKIFPQARDYKTVTVEMTPERVHAIEESLAAPLDQSEKGEFNFYEITGVVDGKPGTLGNILALAGKGEYGVIEVVIGVDRNGKIVGAYIQRSRERATAALRSENFLRQFAGKTKADRLEIGADVKPAGSEAEAASRVVAFTVKKMLVFYHVLKGEGPS